MRRFGYQAKHIDQLRKEIISYEFEYRTSYNDIPY